MAGDLAKRAFDIVASLVGLIVLSPAMFAIAVSILVDSGPPVLFSQDRVGLKGRTFRIHKFRTMRPAAGPKITADGDPRVTRVGAFLRRTKLDELPQLWDVLRGAMSFVGPRPEVPGMFEHYPAEARRRIVSVRPGITDLATLEFSDEEAILAGATDPEKVYLEKVVPRKIALYLDYLDRRSFGLDLVILGRTLKKLVGWG